MRDSSPYRWLEDRGPVLPLIARIDDASSRFQARFAEHDSTPENRPTREVWLRRYGRPREVYTDRNSIFHTTRPVPWAEQLEGVPAQTQFQRALHDLGIPPIRAPSPPAQGRIERLCGTLQDRLVQEMRLAAVNTREQANGYREQVLVPFWEQRFTVAPRSVAHDYTVRWQGQLWAVAPGLRRARAEVEQRLDGSVWLRFRNHSLPLLPCPVPVAATPPALRPPGVTANTKPKRKYLSPPDHPWRKRTFLPCGKEHISILR